MGFLFFLWCCVFECVQLMDYRMEGKAPLLPNEPNRSAISSFCSSQWKWCSALASGPVLACVAYFAMARSARTRDYGTLVAPMSAALAWVFAWWVAEPVPIPVTSLLPLVLLPALGVCSAAQVSASYASDTIFLILGSSVLAAAVEKHSAHRRTMLHMVCAFGGPAMRPRQLLLGFCLSSFLASTLVDNYPTAAMMIPLVTDMARKLHVANNNNNDDDDGRAEGGADSESKREFVKALLLGIVYGVSIGGAVTLTGNGANMALSSLWVTLFPKADSIGYLEWLSFGFPYGMVVILGTWGILCLSFIPTSSLHTISSSLKDLSIHQSITELGPVTLPEKSIFTLFLVFMTLLVTRTGIGSFSGWSGIFNGNVANGTITVFMAIFLFVLPNGKEDGKKLMDWSDCRDISWGILLLIGGGLALADGFTSSGLDAMVSDYLKFMDSISFVFIILIIGIVTAIVTEFTSNTATTTMFVPLMAQIAMATNNPPLAMLVATTIGAQTSFILQCGCPVNALAYATGFLETKDLLKPGLALKVVAVVWLSILMPTLGVRVFNNTV